MNPPEAQSRLHLRPMTQEDVEAVYAIDVLSFALPWSQRAYRYELTQNPNARMWVACLPNERGNERVAGMIVTWIILDEAHIGTVAVHPDVRRQGVADGLLRQALHDAAQQGAQKVYLEVRRGNVAAQGLYTKYGFVVAGVRPRYYQDNQEDAILMTLDPLEVGA